MVVARVPPSTAPMSMSTHASPWRRVRRALARLHGRLDQRAVYLLGDAPSVPVLDACSTGHDALDHLLGTHGWPRGRMVEVYGPPAVGKTTLALRSIARVQQGGATCAFIDMEHGLDLAHAVALGVQPERLVLARPDCGEDAFQVIEELLRAKACDLIVVDSVAALVPRAELHVPMGTAPPGLHARLVSVGLRRIAALASRASTTLLFLNQVRRRVDHNRALTEETTSGGTSLHAYTSVRVELRRTGAQHVRATLTKNRAGNEGASVDLTSPPPEPQRRAPKEQPEPPMDAVDVDMSQDVTDVTDSDRPKRERSTPESADLPAAPAERDVSVELRPS